MDERKSDLPHFIFTAPRLRRGKTFRIWGVVFRVDPETRSVKPGTDFFDPWHCFCSTHDANGASRSNGAKIAPPEDKKPADASEI